MTSYRKFTRECFSKNRIEIYCIVFELYLFKFEKWKKIMLKTSDFYIWEQILTTYLNDNMNSHINVNFYYLLNETNLRFAPITVLKL